MQSQLIKCHYVNLKNKLVPNGPSTIPSNLDCGRSFMILYFKTCFNLVVENNYRMWSLDVAGIITRA